MTTTATTATTTTAMAAITFWTGSCYCCFDFDIPVDNGNHAHVYGQNVCAIYAYNEACDDGIHAEIMLTAIIASLDLQAIYKYYQW